MNLRSFYLQNAHLRFFCVLLESKTCFFTKYFHQKLLIFFEKRKSFSLVRWPRPKKNCFHGQLFLFRQRRDLAKLLTYKKRIHRTSIQGPEKKEDKDCYYLYFNDNIQEIKENRLSSKPSKLFTKSLIAFGNFVS